MKMIILRKDQITELEKLNEENAHLYRALMPIKMKDGNGALNIDILSDKVTWSAWTDFLEELPVREVKEDELI